MGGRIGTRKAECNVKPLASVGEQFMGFETRAGFDAINWRFWRMRRLVDLATGGEKKMSAPQAEMPARARDIAA